MNKLSFEQLPQAVGTLLDKVAKIETLSNETNTELPQSDRSFNLPEFCTYLPDKSARQNVYGRIEQMLIPYHKKGKKLQFIKSEIDHWLKSEKHKRLAEIRPEAEQFILARKGGSR